jgi:hypothetical protein
MKPLAPAKPIKKVYRPTEYPSISRKSALNMLGMTGNSSDTVGRINKIKSDLDVKSDFDKDYSGAKPVDLGSVPASDFTKAKTKLVEDYGGPDNPDYRMDKGDYYWNEKKGKIRAGYTEYPEDAGEIKPRYLGKNWDNAPNRKSSSPLNNYQSPSGNKYFSNREDFQRLQNDITGSVWNVAKQRTGAEQAKAKEKFDIGMAQAKSTATDFKNNFDIPEFKREDLAMKASKGFGVSRKKGLWDNIHAKRKRIKAGSGEKMRKPGSKGAPSAKDLKDSQNKK